MSSSESVPRKLSEIFKCSRCRTSKCEPEGREWPQKCDTCIKAKRDCGIGTPSRRGKQLPAKKLKSTDKHTTAGASNTKYPYRARPHAGDNAVGGWKGTHLPISSGASSQEFGDSGVFHFSFLIEPSNPRVPNRMTHEMDRRLGSLWGNKMVFDRTNVVSDQFSRIVSDFFAIKARQMAANYAIVWEALYACGAADALRNRRLPEHIRRDFGRFYNIHDTAGRRLINAAIDEHEERVASGKSLDVLPLYYAIFLLHASGACERGSQEIGFATAAMAHLNRYTDEFPLKIELLHQSEDKDDWTVKMLLVKYPEDLGMEIGRKKFPLGNARIAYDNTEVVTLGNGLVHQN